MKRAGRVSVLTLVVIFAVIIGVVVLFVFSSGDAPDSAAATFMDALARGNVDTLAELSDMGDKSPEQTKKEWNFTVNEAAPYYRFQYQIQGTTISDPKDAVAHVKMLRNAGKPGSYEEDMELPLIKADDKWKVDVKSMNQEFFPFLPW